MIRVERVEKRAASRCQADDPATQENDCEPVSFALVFEHGNGAGGHAHSTRIRVCELHARQLLEGLSRELCPLCGGAGVVYGGLDRNGDPCALCSMFEPAETLEDVLAPADAPPRRKPGKNTILVGRLSGIPRRKLHRFAGTGEGNVSSFSFCGRQKSGLVQSLFLVTPAEAVADFPGDMHHSRLCRNCFSQSWIRAARRAAGMSIPPHKGSFDT